MPQFQINKIFVSSFQSTKWILTYGAKHIQTEELEQIWQREREKKNQIVKLKVTILVKTENIQTLEILGLKAADTYFWKEH